MPTRTLEAARRDPELEALREGFVTRMWRGYMFVAAIAIPIVLWRAYTVGWMAMHLFHLSMIAVVLGIGAIQPRLPLGTRAILLICLLWMTGVPGLFFFGLSAASVWWLVLSSLVAGVIFSPRTGLIVATATGVLMAGVGLGFVSGALHPSISADAFLVMASSWATLILVSGVFSVMVLRAFTSYVIAAHELLLRIKQQRDVIERLSLHDPLTGLPLASLANDRIQMAMHAARRASKRMALLFVDLDEFKRINDSGGHDFGDAVLKLSAERMLTCLRSEDTVARIGGDEFLVVLGGIGQPVQAARVSEKLIRALSQPIEHQGRSLQVGASIGIALYPDDASEVQDLRRTADLAMYEAKRQGRGRWQFSREPADEAQAPVPERDSTKA